MIKYKYKNIMKEKTLKIFTTYEKNGVIGVNVFEKSI